MCRFTYTKDHLIDIGKSVINNHCNKPIWSTLVELNIAKRTKRVCRGGRNKIRSIKPLITERKQTLKTSLHSNSANLIKCPISHQSYSAQINCRFAVWNAARMNKKNCTTSIIDFIVSNKLDILAITETWLKGGKQDDCVLADIQNALPNFDVHHVPRQSRDGGGVCIILRKGFEIQQNEVRMFESFEHMDVTISSGSKSIRVFLIYRPPPSKVNKLKVSDFTRDFSTLMECFPNITTSG